MLPLDQCRLYTFVDIAYLRGAAAASVARQLCDGGSDLVQLRAKDRTGEEIKRLADEIGPVLRRAGVGFVLNDHWDIARECGADLCHLGQEDFFDAGFTRADQLSGDSVAGVRLSIDHSRRAGVSPAGSRSVPPRRPPGSSRAGSLPILGLSTHSPDEALRAIAAGPAYIAIGPVYATQTKPGAPAVTLDYVRWAAAEVKIPWFAIGGINLERLAAVLEAGARGICVVSAILNAPDIAAACREFKRRMK